MSLESDVRLMAGARPFDLLPREALQIVAFSCKKEKLKAGQSLFELGAPADGAFLVISGALRLAANGAERKAEPGALVGEMALLTDVTRRASARADGDCELLRIPGDVFRRVLSEFPAVAREVRKSLSGRTRQLVAGLDAVRDRFEA